MLKISVLEDHDQLRLVVEGNLTGAWASQLRTACDKASLNLHDRELVIELKNAIAISQTGETVLLGFMKQGVTLRSQGVFTKHILTELARRVRARLPEITR